MTRALSTRRLESVKRLIFLGVAALLMALAPAAAAQDSPPPFVDIDDSFATEGGPASFVIRLSKPSSVPVSMDFVDGSGTAAPPLDYAGGSGTITIPAGNTSAVLVVPTVLDFLLESNELFRIELSNAQNATFRNRIAQATILNTLLPGRCANKLFGRSGVDVLTGSAAGDEIFGRGTADFLAGLGGDDCLIGEGGRDEMRGGNGADELVGGSGSDSLDGGSGNDRLVGGRGRNTYIAGSGNDSVYARNGIGETVDCGSGTDRVKADRRDALRSCERRIPR